VAEKDRIPIDWKKVDDLLLSGCTGTEVAAYLGCHPDTLYIRVEKEYGMAFSAYLAEKRSKGESLLRAHQYAKALGYTEKGDNTLLIWLGKQRLSQREPESINAALVAEADIKRHEALMAQIVSLQEERARSISESKSKAEAKS